MGKCDPYSEHCFHGTGMVLTSNPPLVETVCCHCGEKNTMRDSPPTTQGHGPHHPNAQPSRPLADSATDLEA